MYEFLSYEWKNLFSRSFDDQNPFILEYKRMFVPNVKNFHDGVGEISRLDEWDELIGWKTQFSMFHKSLQPIINKYCDSIGSHMLCRKNPI